ncbi:MAG: hypothetical protein IJT73_05825 [Selenomonadaceae bacterium]|nr:hypothetical protein [Selenomonadaceae bacterium]
MRTDMPKKDRNALIGVVVVMLSFFLTVVFYYFEKEINMHKENIYKPVPFFDELYSNFWSGYLNLSFMDRSLIGIVTLILLCIIGLFIIKKMPAILQWTLLPTFAISVVYDNSLNNLLNNMNITPFGWLNTIIALIFLSLWGDYVF